MTNKVEVLNTTLMCDLFPNKTGLIKVTTSTTSISSDLLGLRQLEEILLLLLPFPQESSVPSVWSSSALIFIYSTTAQCKLPPLVVASIKADRWRRVFIYIWSFKVMSAANQPLWSRRAPTEVLIKTTSGFLVNIKTNF